jgi:transposase
MTYPLSFRTKVLSIKAKENLSFAEAAKRFGVGIASLVRWVKKPTPQTHRNKPATKLNMEQLKQDIALYPDAYQYERAERLKVSPNGIWHALRRLKVTFKKNASPSKSKPRKTLCFLPDA